jgi:hypothetical protein
VSERFLDLIIVLWLIVVPFSLLHWYLTRKSRKLRQPLAQQGLGHAERDAPPPAQGGKDKKTFAAILAAIGAFLGVIALEIASLIALAEMTGSRPPRGSPLFLLPAIAAGVWAWRRVRYGAQKPVAGGAYYHLQSLSREGRFKLVLSLLWAGLLCVFWLVAKPYRYTYGLEHAMLFLMWLILPPLAALGALKALRWASQGNP